MSTSVTGTGTPASRPRRFAAALATAAALALARGDAPVEEAPGAPQPLSVKTLLIGGLETGAILDAAASRLRPGIRVGLALPDVVLDVVARLGPERVAAFLPECVAARGAHEVRRQLLPTRPQLRGQGALASPDVRVLGA